MAGGATAERTEKEKGGKINRKELLVCPVSFPGASDAGRVNTQFPQAFECCIVTIMFKLSRRMLNCSLGDLCVILHLELLRRMLNCSFADRSRHLGYWIVPLHGELSSCILHYELECMNCDH